MLHHGRKTVQKESVISSNNELDRGLLYGEACFETMRVIKGEIFAWDAHLARLQQGLAAFALACPQGLLSRCLEAAERVGEDALLRLTLSGGITPRGLIPDGERTAHAHIQAWPYHPATEPLALRTLHWPLRGMSRMAKFTADYAFTIRLLHQARHAGQLGEHEQALFTLDDDLLCMETANILLLLNGEWLTPDSDALLPGVVRAALLEAGVLRACRSPADWLQVCDAVAICNSGCFIRPVSVVNGRRLDEHAGRFAVLLDALRGRKGVPENILCA
jgi:branched-subunit amino acid aminotransferase/4-amino-4-deoxychorismate lyase